MRMLKQSTAASVMVLMVDSTDHVTGKTGLTLTITASKNGAAFGSITPTVNDRGSGWYELQLTTSHTDTLGDLAFHITGTAADPTDFTCRVVAGALDADVSTRALETGGNLAAVKGKTDNLPTDPADESLLEAAIAAVQADTNDIQSRLPAALVGGKMDASIGAVVASSLTAAAFAAGAIDANALANDAVEEIATKVLTWASSNWESAAAVKSLGAAVMKAVHRIRDNAGTIEVYLSNGSTLKFSQTPTTDATLEPIKELTGAA